jgi:hypothetical protein
LNRCTPYRGKPNQHATRFPRSVRVWSTTIHISRGPHIATFHTVVNRFEQIHCTREEGLPGPYHRHAIGTFNTCSRGPTERSLIDTGGGYKPGGAGLPHTHSPTFPTRYPHFPLMAPPGLHFNQILVKDQSVEFLKNLWPPCGLSTTWPPTVAYI